MPNDIQQYSSVSGEFAPNLWGRSDFQKYDSAWAEARNWLVDYRGGLFTRPGLEFGDIVQWNEGEGVKLVEFQYSPDTANTYILVFSDEKLRFMQDNAYVLEAAVTISSITNDSGDRVLITATAHGYSDGDWVKFAGMSGNNSGRLVGMTAQVANKTANTFNLINLITGASLEIATVTSTTHGSVYRVYTIASPYGEDELANLKTSQVRDYLRMTHPDYPIKNLIRNGATSWTISNETIGASVSKVTGLNRNGNSNAEGEAFVYRVTAVNDEGEEGLPDIMVETNCADILNNNGKWIEIEWATISDAVYYNVYRSRSIDSDDRIYPDQECGYIGQASGTIFTDDGITADFDIQSPLNYNPFANGAIRYVEVTAGGTTYNYNDDVTWPAGGTGAYGYMIANDGSNSGAVRGIMIIDGGSGYTATNVTSADGDANFAGTAELSPASGNNPHCCAIFQQRMVYGATDNYPLRLFGSRPGQLSNFNYTQIGADDDSYEFDLDAPKVAPIRHIVPVRGGMMVFNQIGCWLVFGNNDEALTSFNVKIDYQNSVGASQVQPVLVDNYVVYVSEIGQEIRLLAYTEDSRVYEGRNLSLLSNHLFNADDPITSMTYAAVPFKIIYATQESGRLIALTIDNQNSVYGATPLWTKGYFRYVLSVDEERESRVYVAVQRKIGTRQLMFVERFFRRDNYELLDEAKCLDCAGTNTGGTMYPAARVNFSSATGAVTVTASAAVFNSGYIGYDLRAGDGKIRLSAYSSTTVMTGTWTRDLTDTYPETTSPAEFVSGDWDLSFPEDAPTGLWWLEGETVEALGDGEHYTGLTVSAGSVDFTGSDTASRYVVGLPFDCVARTLPLTASDTPIEGRKKANKALALRIFRSIGLKLGPSIAKLRTVAIRAQRLGWTATDELQTEIIYEAIRQDWSRDAQVYVVQDSPRPAAILNFIRNVDLGDDGD